MHTTEVWLLMLYMLCGPPFLGGGYPSEEMCRIEATEQWPNWLRQHDRKLKSFDCIKQQM